MQRNSGGGGCAAIFAVLFAVALVLYAFFGIGNALDLTPTFDEISDEKTEGYEGVAVGAVLTLLVIASLRLKRSYGKWILILMAAQLGVVNGAFILMAWWGYDWMVPAGIVQVWLAGTFVQIVSIVYVITRSLFPSEPPAAQVGSK